MFEECQAKWSAPIHFHLTKSGPLCKKLEPLIRDWEFSHVVLSSQVVWCLATGFQYRWPWTLVVLLRSAAGLEAPAHRQDSRLSLYSGRSGTSMTNVLSRDQTRCWWLLEYSGTTNVCCQFLLQKRLTEYWQKKFTPLCLWWMSNIRSFSLINKWQLVSFFIFCWSTIRTCLKQWCFRSCLYSNKEKGSYLQSQGRSEPLCVLNASWIGPEGLEVQVVDSFEEKKNYHILLFS